MSDFKKTENKIYFDNLAKIDRAQKDYNLKSQNPASKEEIDKAAAQAKKELHCELPQEYREFLSVSNGLNWNGLFIYAARTVPINGNADATIEGIVEANLGWRDDEFFSDYLIFGEGNMDLYTYNIPNSLYEVIDRVGNNTHGTFASFDELLDIALEHHL